MSKILEYIKQVITANPILIYPDPDKQYFLSADSSKHLGWSFNTVFKTDKKQWNQKQNTTPNHLSKQNSPRLSKELEHSH